MSGPLTSFQEPSDDGAWRCKTCRTLGEGLSTFFHRVELALIRESAAVCSTCAMLRAAVEVAVEFVEGSPTWMEIRFKRPPFLHGPLRIDITARRAATRLQLYIPTGKRPLSTAPFIVARNSWSAGHPPSPWSQIGVADHVEPHALSDKCVDLARRWMQSCTICEEQHMKCSRPIVPSLPTRVIYVGKSDQEIRLHASRPGETSHYAALSHCWGGVVPI